MGEAIITRRNFGGSKIGDTVFATINVTYPSGSICSCVMGNTTLTAKDTSGTVKFIITEIGTWTVTCINGTKSESQSVNITTKGQSENIELTYDFVLLSMANGLANGYSLKSYAITPAIDVTGYSTIELVGRVTWRSSSGLSIYFGLSETVSGDFIASANVNKTTEATYTIDISGLTGIYYFSADYTLSIEDNELISSTEDSADLGVAVRLSSVILK